eukprot:gene9247-7294_t
MPAALPRRAPAALLAAAAALSWGEWGAAAQEVWENDNGISTAPAVEGGTVYYGDDEGTVYAQPAAGGPAAWSHQLSG